MTEQTFDRDNLTDSSAPAEPIPPPAEASPKPARSGGRGLAALALLAALGAGGGSGYLWYLWQQDQATQASRMDQAIKQALAQRDPEFQELRTKIAEIQALKGLIEQNKSTISQLRTDDQNLRDQLLGLTGDLQPLKNAMELQKGETEIVKNEVKLLREGQEAHKALTQQQRQELDARLNDQQNRLAELDKRLQNLQLSYTGLADNLDVVKTLATKGGDVNAFPLAEADYLLRLADAKLKLERNVPTALLALDAAQQRLKTVSEEKLATVQTMLGEALASLRGVRLPDLNALAHKLVEIEDQVADLPLKLESGVPDIRERIKPATTVTVSDDTERSWWDRTSEAVWRQFRDIVVIRRQRIEAPPLIAREEEFFLRQNLQLELESMRTALLRGHAETYQDSHKLVSDWVQRYFETSDPKVGEFLAELQALQAVQLNPYVPDLTGLRLAFQEFINQRQVMRTLQNAPPPPASQPVPAPAPAPAEQPATDTGAPS